MLLSYKDIDESKLSKGMAQYLEIKRNYMDNILFFRLGDFYEMFFDDAVLVSKELELTLTSKDCGLSTRAPMCGVPYHAGDQYIKRLVDKGYSVVVCEQMEDPATASGIVKREVVKIVTPGTVTDGSMLDDSANNWLASVYIDSCCAAVCLADVSTGTAHLYSYDGRELESFLSGLLYSFSPSEILFPKESDDSIISRINLRLMASLNRLDSSYFDFSKNKETVLAQFTNDSFASLGLFDSEPSARAASALFLYIERTQRLSVGRFVSIQRHSDGASMMLGYTARTNLEITKTLRSGEKRGSLLWVLDRTKTAMGKRLLKTCLEQPLVNPAAIIKRLDAVDAMYNATVELRELRGELSGIYDLERLMTKVMYRSAGPHDLLALAGASKRLPAVKELLGRLSGSELLASLNSEMSTLEDIVNLIDNAISQDAPQMMKDGGYIKDGFSAQLDEQRAVAAGGREIIDKICLKERELTGIKNLKIGYNRVFGYYIEVTRSFYDMVPKDRYIRKQTLANCERFITSELKEAEDSILGAKDRIAALESEIFLEVREYLSRRLAEVQRTASAIAYVDLIASFADAAIENGYIKPDIAIDGVISIKNGRHPVVERMLREELFVPNDAYLDLNDNRMIILTGPNMSGKSTYMRQIALIVVMAQIGSFVPADYAKISIVDQIFTRVGASDDLASGQSTFMVEMSEVADILKNATKNSLVILDEVGRGTSTFDGISIARSVAEYIASGRRIGCKTLFATHYHELIALESACSGIRNYSVAVRRSKDGVRFLRKIVEGGADQSYGIEVAKLAGLPEPILKRAKEILSELEEKRRTASGEKPEEQVTFSSISREDAVNMLKKTNIDELSDGELRELVRDVISRL